jgi:guanylate kinase
VKPVVLVLCAPSGGGKTTIAQTLLARRRDVGFSVSGTTRKPRPGEANGREYWFLTREEFARRRDAGDFVEWAEYGGEWYGTLKAEVDRLFREGKHVILDIEVQGARQVRTRFAEAVLVFILPPSPEALLERLRARHTEGAAQLAARLRTAVGELEEAPRFDHVVINDDLDRAVGEIAGILDQGKGPPRRPPDLAERLRRMRDGLRDQLRSMQ